jgi:ATP-dependent Clp endopeptidase proteolytic subunit ClpP
MRTYSMQAKGNKKATITIYTEIGGYWDGISANQFAKDLKALGDIDEINLRISSPGGEVFDGQTIYTILKSHKARVIVDIDGLAASIASVIAMAGDEIRMADNALMMIHNAWGYGVGTAEDLRSTADLLEKVNGTIIGTYVKRTGKDEADIVKMMDAETWMSAAEAKEHGFIDSITDALEMAASFDLSKFRYRNTPKAVVQQNLDHRVRLAHMSLAAQKIRTASSPKQG